jgi:hypothetical protein
MYTFCTLQLHLRSAAKSHRACVQHIARIDCCPTLHLAQLRWLRAVNYILVCRVDFHWHLVV